VALSIYVHIPYCLQRCRYCDFTTFQHSEILSPEKYVAQVFAEIENRQHLWRDRDIHSIYFGGGTPSLLSSDLIISILDHLANAGFRWSKMAEITIEINPATMDESKLDAYLNAGINRFSVGAQTFDDSLLLTCGRKHSAKDTRDTLRILKARNLNYSFDLLFALPDQSLGQLRADLEEVCEFQPPHLSAYCLTVPEGHPMSRGRAPEDEQVEMFHLIETQLGTIGLEKYEISNFARPGFESRHNLVYWNDQNYWGLGVSAHSYNRDSGRFGERFWNSKDIRKYGEQSLFSEIPENQRERLQQHEAMTDFCHMFLRTKRGFSWAALRNKFNGSAAARIENEARKLITDGLLEVADERLRLTARGEMISNQVFERLTFLPPQSTLTQAKSTPYLSHER
jgi:oxygen-independent coproporphyrinogen-3 oxidase